MARHRPVPCIAARCSRVFSPVRPSFRFCYVWCVSRAHPPLRIFVVRHCAVDQPLLSHRATRSRQSRSNKKKSELSRTHRRPLHLLKIRQEVPCVPENSNARSAIIGRSWPIVGGNDYEHGRWRDVVAPSCINFLTSVRRISDQWCAPRAIDAPASALKRKTAQGMNSIVTDESCYRFTNA